MQSTISKWLLGAGTALVLIACSKQASPATDSSGTQALPSTNEAALAGWYVQHEGEKTFQPCGQSGPWRIGATADLDAHVQAFGLDDDTPVYVKVQVSTHTADETVDIIRVVQFGSPTPVSNCAMTGVVRPSEPTKQ